MNRNRPREWSPTPTVSRSTYDAVVIGSGFGGSINALRLAEAGQSVLVLERGRRYAPRDFPRDVRDVDDLLWGYPDEARSHGLFDFRTLSGVSTAVAAGVGGGSLIYASIHYRPQARIFEDPRWPEPFDLDSLGPYYERVSAELGVEPVPGDVPLPKRDAFHRAAKAMQLDSFDTPQAVSWTKLHGSTEGHGQGRKTCQHCAECEFGCRYGAKNTLDFTYLAKAEALGAQVATGFLVTHVSPARGGGWHVHYEDMRTGQPAVVTGRKVVLAAGTLGSNEILLRSRDEARTLPKLSRRLGRGYSANGDYLGNVQNANFNLDPWVGPDVTSVAWHYPPEGMDKPGFVLATPTYNRPVMEVLASFGQPPTREAVKLFAPMLWRSVPGLLRRGFRSGLVSKPLRVPATGAGPARRHAIIFAIGQDNANGRLVLRRGKLDMLWDYARENAELVRYQRQAMEELCRHYGGTFGEFPLWGPFKKTFTVHNLGGCALSSSAAEGVVDINGQVHGHPGLFVADGAVIPTAIGSHPVMTISAVAEWIAERVVAA